MTQNVRPGFPHSDPNCSAAHVCCGIDPDGRCAAVELFDEIAGITVGPSVAARFSSDARYVLFVRLRAENTLG